MAQVIIREFSNVGSVYGISAQAPAEPAQTDQTIATSATTASSAAFGANTRLLGISTPAASAVAYLVSPTPGVTPTALVTSQRLPANSLVYVAVRPLDKIAFIDVT